MAGRKRSKSPAARKKASSAVGFDFNDANVQLLVTVGVLTGLVFLTQGGFMIPNWLNFFNNDGPHFAFWPFGGLVLTMHCLNTCQGSGKGFWAGSFTNAVIACFAGQMAPELVSGSAQSILANESTLTLVFVCWYLTNHNVPLVDFDLWGTISGAGGSALASIMDLCSLVFTTNLIMHWAGSSAGAGWFGFSFFVPVMMGTLAGTASEFFPLNKGIFINSCSAEMERAALISLFVCTNGFSALPIIGEPVGAIVAQATAHFGGNQGFIMSLTIINHLFGQFIPINPMDQVKDVFYKLTGLTRG